MEGDDDVRDGFCSSERVSVRPSSFLICGGEVGGVGDVDVFAHAHEMNKTIRLFWEV